MTTKPLRAEATLHYADGRTDTIKQQDLSREEVRREVAKGVLTDVSENLLLFIRKGRIRGYHFVAKSSSRLSGCRRVDPDPKNRSVEHDTNVNLLLSYLMGEQTPRAKKGNANDKQFTSSASHQPENSHDCPAVAIVTRQFVKNRTSGKTKTFDVALAHLGREMYVWAKEVTRYVGVDGLVRHDVFGHCTSPKMSILRPNIAIEVIYCHPPSARTLDLMFKASRESPLIILFWILRTRNYHFECASETDRIRIRSTYYMLDGVIYKNEKKLCRFDEECALGIFENEIREAENKYARKG